MENTTKKQFDSYLVGLQQSLELYGKYNKARDMKDKIEYASGIIGEEFEEDMDESNLDERVQQYFECLELNIYKEENGDNRIIDVLLAFGGPNIRLRLETRRDTAELDYYRGGDHFTYSYFSKEEIDALFRLYDYNY